MGRKPRKPYHYLAILISLLIICQSVIATPQTVGVKLAQQPTYDTQEANRAAAERAEVEAKELSKQDAPITQVIAKEEEALKYWRLAGDKKKEAETLVMITVLYDLRGDYRKMLDYSQQQLAINQILDDRTGKVSAFIFMAMSYDKLGEYQEAIDNYHQALLLAEDLKIQSAILSTIAFVYQKLGETQKMIDSLKQALAIWQEQGDVAEQAKSFERIAFIYAILGEIDKGYEALKQAKTVDLNFKIEEFTSYYMLSLFSCVSQSEAVASQSVSPKPDSLPKQSQDANALDYLNQRVQKYKVHESLEGEASSLDMVGLMYEQLGEYQQGLDAYNQVLQLKQMSGNRTGEAEAFTSIADVLSVQGNKQEAINKLNQAREIQRQIENRPGEASTLATIGQLYQTLGAYSLSLNTYAQALSLFHYIGDRLGEGNTLNDIAYIYRLLKNYQQSLNYYQQALLVAQTSGNCTSEAVSLSNIGRVYSLLGDYQKAINIGNEALSVSRNLSNGKKIEATVLGWMGFIYKEAGNYQKALEFSQKSLNMAREITYRDREAYTLALSGEIYEALQQSEQAIKTYQDQLSLWRTMGLRPEEAKTLYIIARTQSKSGQLNEALTNIKAAIEIVENLRTTLASPELRTSYFATVQDYYELYIDILMQLHQKDPTKGYDAQAYHISERARARTLLELLNEANADIRQGADPTLLEQERTLLQKLNAIEKRRIELYSNNQSTQEQKAGIEKERQTLLSQYQDIQAQIRATSPRYAALTQPEPLTLTQVQQQLLDDDTILLQYSLGQERSYLWLVSKDGMSSYQLPKQAEIEDKAKAFYNLLLNNNYQLENRGGLVVVPTETNQKVASELSKILLEPIANQLGKKRLVIVADGALQYIPFATLSLPTTHELLINHYQISYLPSSSSLAIIRQETAKQPKGTKTLAIIADPVFSQNDTRVQGHHTPQNNTDDLNRAMLDRSSNDLDIGNWKRLPGTRREAEAILSLIPSSERMQAFDFGANFATATNPNLSQYRIVHYATHGLLNSVHPELSGVVLSLVDEGGNSQNGFLRLNDIFNLNLGSDLVVLSACQTGLGQEVKGEGLIGLTRGFMYAGSPRVLVSLWNVSDEATAEMMTRFYRLMLREKLPPSQALRQAQLEMQQQTQWKSPYYWAAFVLQGEWQ